jgi:hypothetical protein
MNLPGLMAARKRWREQSLADPAVLLSRLGPEIRCEVPAAKMRIAAFGDEMTVQFDVNTVQPGILRLIPAITEGEIAAWLAARSLKPFTSREDFQARAGLNAATLGALKF